MSPGLEYCAAMRGLTVLLGASIALALVGCGGTAVDSTAMEEDLTVYLEKSLHERVKSVDCPADEPVEKGLVFECDVKLEGGDEVPLAVEITSEDADYRVKRYGGANE
jgi:uncharacterized protein DUF4333